MYRVTVYERVEEIPSEQWNSLARGADFTLTTPMLALIQRSRPKMARFFMVWDATMTPRGAVPIYLLHESTTVSAYQRPDLMLRRVAGPEFECFVPGAKAILPAVSIGSHQVTSARVLIDRSIPVEEQQACISLLLSQIEEQARSWGACSICCPYVAGDDAVLRTVLLEHDYFSFPNVWLAVLDICWSSFSDYLQSLSGKRRHSIRRERLQIARAGVELSIAPLQLADVARLEILKGNVDAKYHGESARRPPSENSFLAVAARERPGEPLVVLARKEGEIVAFCLCYRYRDELYCEQVGFDYERTARLPLYFEVGYYQPITYAIEQKLKRIHYGAEAYKAKLWRGCHLELQTAFMKCFDLTTHQQLAACAAMLDEQRLS
ncbi:hypothetical protein KTAU_25600 [Thermogemmatispora aurantia]|uniref:BioF2-like acetyltransferase domain-containing protein n=3 Tax=Thermogemmatispora TaxID=768669 RepID=A0A5J4K8J6_9CHLR|nr:GNAT family N-acetyltransferase [Thermogemmatispora aurantia]GER83923.1 hypothetical protein KTAU_25600 [Thermogemmatispora aurantia]